MLVKTDGGKFVKTLSAYAEDVLADRYVHDDPVNNLNLCADRTATALGRLLEVLVEKKVLSIDDAARVIGGEKLRIVK